MRRFNSALTCFGFAALLGLAGCTQDLGQRCQADRDCADGLKCNVSQQVCVDIGAPNIDGGGGGIDAPLDAAVIDATEIDASIDAP